MTTRRDPDALLAAYLADGMTVLSDRVIDAVLDEAHRTRQRAGFGPRRTLDMLKPFFAATAAIVAVAVGAYALGLLKLTTTEPGSSATPPVTTPSVAPSPTTQPSFVSLQRGELEPGVWQARLAERVVRIDVPGDQGRVFGTVWPDAKTVLIQNIQGDFTIQSGLWRTNREWCHPTTDIIELPDTPDAIAEWLHAMDEVDVTDRPDVPVDGRVAKSFDLMPHLGCYDSSEPPPGNIAPWQGQLENFVVYAVPTDGQAILVMSFAAEENVEPAPAFREYLDAFVRSMTFPS